MRKTGVRLSQEPSEMLCKDELDTNISPVEMIPSALPSEKISKASKHSSAAHSKPDEALPSFANQV